MKTVYKYQLLRHIFLTVQTLGRNLGFCRSISLLFTGLKNQESAHQYHRNSKQKPFWFPSCKLKSNASRLYLSLERINLILISFLSVCFGGFHIYCWNGPELGSEKAVMWCISLQLPSANLARLSVEAGEQLHCPSRGQKTGWETKSRYSIFDDDIAETMAHLMFQVNGVLHDFTFLRKWNQSDWKRSKNIQDLPLSFSSPTTVSIL